jgi:hypothetical protein
MLNQPASNNARAAQKVAKLVGVTAKEGERKGYQGRASAGALVASLLYRDAKK